MIEALALRYVPDPEADRAPLDRAYAAAMGELHEQYPGDSDVATLYAAALMELSPWDYWTKDGRPKEHTTEFLAALEAAIALDPEHEGALHYYIHAVEAIDPDRGVAAADRLRGLAPGAGHLMHMPSHIYMQVGRFAEAYEANALAAEADEGYITQCRAQGIYPLNYYPHNVHFLAWAAVLQGRSADALAAARKVASRVPDDLQGNDWALYETFLGMPLVTLARFGRWEEILAEPKPRADARYWTGLWHATRGDAATAEVAIGFSNGRTLLTIAREVLAGEIEAKAKNYGQALQHLSRAARLEDALPYNEPPDWFIPVRHTLGAVLIEAGLPEEAETVYWQDLRRRRDNAHSLFGLMAALEAQGKETGEIAARFAEAWGAADVTLRSSRF
jgi:tetratricopeptide (TPR) repeat protein